MKDAKAELRGRFRKTLQRQEPARVADWNRQISRWAREILEQRRPAGFVAAFRGRPTEPDLTPVFQAPFRFCFPRILDTSGNMDFRAVEDPLDSKSFEPNLWGILEPKEFHPAVPVIDIGICFIPLLAFDNGGRRLGQGKGFYDRFLQEFGGLKIGVAFECQRTEDSLPVEDHDEHLEFVITETGLHRF